MHRTNPPISFVPSRPTRAHAAALLLASLSLSTSALAQVTTRSIAELLTLPSGHGDAALTIDAPDAAVSAAHDAFGVNLRVRSRIVARAATLEALNTALAEAKSAAKPRPFDDGAGTPLPGFFLIDCASVREAISLANTLRADPRIAETFVESAPHQARGIPSDPGLPQQWHLINPITPAASINVAPAWMSNITGAGVVVGIIDEGFNALHPDLAANFNAVVSQPDGGSFDHATSTAGLVAAVANNNRGGVGVAFNSQIARLYYGFESDNAAAFLFHNEVTAIKTNSWGPSDIGRIYPMSSIELSALDQSVNTGRANKGEVFIWAAGNGAQSNNDRVDYDGYGSNRYSICIGAIDNIDRAAQYSEAGASVMLVAPSSYDFAGSGGSGIYTTTGTDITGIGSYTTGFGGTSAAAPIAAGVAALVLQANPNLTWRDVQHVLIRSARQVNPTDPGWVVNGGGHPVHDRFGFGAIDAGAAVALAPTFVSRTFERTYTRPTINLGQAIPDNDPAGIASTVSVAANLSVERVQVVLNAPHANIGDLSITLTSPAGTVVTLAALRFDTSSGYNNYVFTDVHHWDERARGTWTLRVADIRAGSIGVFSSWQLKIYGAPPTCACDWNGNGRTVQDIFDFLNDWFAGIGDFNSDGTLNVQDVFEFLNCWFNSPSC